MKVGPVQPIGAMPIPRPEDPSSHLAGAMGVSAPIDRVTISPKAKKLAQRVKPVDGAAADTATRQRHFGFDPK